MTSPEKPKIPAFTIDKKEYPTSIVAITANEIHRNSGGLIFDKTESEIRIYAPYLQEMRIRDAANQIKHDTKPNFLEGHGNFALRIRRELKPILESQGSPSELAHKYLNGLRE